METTVTQIVSVDAGTASEQVKLNTEFNLIVTILTSGTTGVTDLIVPNGIAASSNTNIINSYNLLNVNRNYLVKEVIAFVESTKAPGFVYDVAKCERDTDYIISSVMFDLLYGGNKQAIQSGVYYYNFNASSTAIPNEIPQTTAAYNYLKELAFNIVQGIEIDTSVLYQTTVTQVTSFPAGTYVEASRSEQLLGEILSIINNGPAGVLQEPIKLLRSTDPAIVAGASLLNSNRDFIRAEVVAYVNTLKAFLYDETTCRRDIGYIIDSVAFDLLRGGNKQSFKSGVYYFGYSTTATEVPNELPQTVSAYRYIKSLVSNIVTAKPILTKYQTTVTQVTNLTSATNYEAGILQDKIDVITGIIRNGPEDYQAPGKRIPISLTLN
ncbi:MAG: Synechococcus phage, partial [Cyanobacteriota bacterium]